MRVAFVNNAKTDLARRGWLAGRYPDHHLYGSNHLGPGIVLRDWRIQPTAARRGSSLGPLRRQARVLAGRPEVVYSANLGAALGLALATPLTGGAFVSICHGGGGSGGYRRALRRVLDASAATIALSATRAEQLQQLAPGARVVPLAWGPDLAFAPFREIAARPAVAGSLVATGKTHRDTATLLRALSRLGGRVPAVVVADPAGLDVPSGTRLVQPGVGAPDEPSSYERVLPLLARAQVVAIPLADRGAYVGITEVIDALACGLPVIHTASPHLDLDVEAVGCGLRVPPGDDTAWAAAVEGLMADPGRAQAMGLRGRRWLEENCSSTRFGAAVRALVTGA